MAPSPVRGQAISLTRAPLWWAVSRSAHSPGNHAAGLRQFKPPCFARARSLLGFCCYCSSDRPMRWFRTNRRFSGALALFALALQLTLAFGHIHLRDFAGIPGVAGAQAQDSSDKSPGHNDADHSANHYCLVCATVSLAGTLVLPDLVALLLPAISTDAQHWQMHAASLGRIAYANFRARAPPLA